MSISFWEDPMRHFQTQSRCTILQFLMVASVQLTCPCPGASQQKTSNSSKYTMNPRARHIVATRAIVANTQHQHNELNAEAINSKRVIWSKSTWCDSKRTEKMFLEMNQKKTLKTGNQRRLQTWTHSFSRVQCVHFNMICFTNALCKDGCVRGVCL